MVDNLLSRVQHIRSSIRLLIFILLAAAPGRATAGEPPEGKPAEDPPLESRLILRYKQMELRPDIKIFGDWQVRLGAGKGGDNAFHVTRAYLGLKMKLVSWIAGRVTLDISQANDLGKMGAATVGADGKVTVGESKLDGTFVARLKYAALELKLPFRDAFGAAIAFGMIHTPYIYWIEHVQGFRFLTKTYAELDFTYPSADLGILFSGHILDYVDYAVGVYNGGGYTALASGKYRDVVGRLSLRPLPRHRWLGGLQLTAYAQIQYPPATGTTHRRYGGAVTWRLADAILSPDCRLVRGDRMSFWLEGFFADEGDVAKPALVRSLGGSFGTRVELPWRLAVVGRVDWLDPDRSLSGNDRWRGLGGIIKRLYDGISVAVAYQGTHTTNQPREQYLGAYVEFGL